MALPTNRFLRMFDDDDHDHDHDHDHHHDHDHDHDHGHEECRRCLQVASLQYMTQPIPHG